jgi:uncharacterized protein YbaP (TraB family)
LKQAIRILILIALLWTSVSTANGEALPLWRVTGATNQIYLLGSIHLLREQDYPLPAAIEKAYEESDSMVMEIDMDDLDPMEAQILIRELGLLPGEQTLRDEMGPELYRRTQDSAERLDIPLELLEKSRPWLAAMTVEQLLLSRFGFDPRFGVEMYLLGKAAIDAKEITGLETLREQFEFLAHMSLDAQRSLLLETLDSSSDLQTTMDNVVAAWKRGDSAYLEEQLLQDIADYPELYARIVHDRNHAWREQITELLQDDKNYLIIVGSLHLIGPDGLPTLLKERNFAVQQLTTDDPVN